MDSCERSSGGLEEGGGGGERGRRERERKMERFLFLLTWEGASGGSLILTFLSSPKVKHEFWEGKQVPLSPKDWWEGLQRQHPMLHLCSSSLEQWNILEKLS